MAGSTPPQFRILNYLLVAPGASLSEVAAYLGVRLPTASVMLVKLAAEGYVLRSRHPTSRRRMQLVLTERGQEVTISVRTALFSRLHAGLDRLEESERGVLQEAMPALRRLFAQVSDTEAETQVRHPAWRPSPRAEAALVSRCARRSTPSPQSSMIATARVHPAEARCTFTGKHTTSNPSAGNASRLCSFSRCE